jgi:RHS repeat-associated protein
LKDHLGSTHAVINSANTVTSAQDYDSWGYLLPNRSYNVNDMKYDYTSKERDNETNYDYFGARYYDSRIARWGQVEPLYNHYIGFTPYNYSLNNPIVLLDKDGRGPRLGNQVIGYEGGGWGVPIGGAIGTGIAFNAQKIYEDVAPGIVKLVKPITETLITASPLNLIKWYIENVYKTENTSEGENEETNESEQQEDSKHESRIRTEENLDKTAKDLIPSRLLKGPNWKEKMSDKTYGGILKIAKDKRNPLKVDAQKMKKLIEQAPRILKKLKE